MLVQSLSYSLSAGPWIHPSTHSTIPITKSPTTPFTNRFICLSLPSQPSSQASSINIFTQLCSPNHLPPTHQSTHLPSHPPSTHPPILMPPIPYQPTHPLTHSSISLAIHGPLHPFTSSPPNALYINPDIHMSPKFTHSSILLLFPSLPSFFPEIHSLSLIKHLLRPPVYQALIRGQGEV